MTSVFDQHQPHVISDSPEELECDIAIIGSGMGGGTLAYALRDSGARVLIVEQGDFLPREPENWSPKAVHMEGRYKNSATWYDGDGRAFVPGNYHYVGGSSKFFGAAMPRMRAEDFDEVEHIDGLSPAWPISYDELESHYQRAESLYWVHGNKGEDPTDPWRSTGFPYPGLEHESAMADFVDSARQQGLHPYAMPEAVDRRDGGACIRCATCDSFPCQVDAKGDADVAAVRPALTSPNVRLLTNAAVTRLETDRSGNRVVAAHMRHAGRPVTVRAGRFAVAAGAVNTAALLLRSASHAHPSGLANGSDQLGRNYMAHVTTFLLGMDPRHTNDVVFQKTLGINDWYLPGPTNSYPLGNVQGLGKLQGAMVKNARKLVPMPVLDAATRRTLDLFLQSEDLPLPHNRVQVDSAGRITLTRNASNLATHHELLARMKKVLRSAGYPIVLHQQLGIEATSHQCGTACMGEDAASSVVDPNGKAHELDNLWIADSSVFPSSAAVNPALTIAALALRLGNSGQLTS